MTWYDWDDDGTIEKGIVPLKTLAKPYAYLSFWYDGIIEIEVNNKTYPRIYRTANSVIEREVAEYRTNGPDTPKNPTFLRPSAWYDRSIFNAFVVPPLRPIVSGVLAPPAFRTSHTPATRAPATRPRRLMLYAPLTPN